MTARSRTGTSAFDADTEAQLIAAVAEGRRDAFALVFDRHQSDVYRFARHMTGDPDVADDVTQETFLALMQAPHRFDASRGTLRVYLLGIARHQVARRLREHRWWAPPVDEEADVAVEDTGDDPLEELCRATDIARVQATVQALTPVFRDALVLCDLLGLSYDEAAASLSCPVGTIRSRLHRARQQLAVALKAEPQPSSEGVISRCLA